LVAATIGFADHLLGRHRTVVGDVKEVAVVLPNTPLSPLFDDRLAKHHDAVGAVRLGGAVFELGEVLAGQT
jgi:hypothetical protein